MWAGTGNDDDLCSSLTDILYNTCTSAKVKNAYPQVESGPADQTALGRWRYVIQKSNPKDLWNAIAWNGTFETPSNEKEQPSDAEFRSHFEALLNVSHQNEDIVIPNVMTHIPLLDEDITPYEVDRQIKKLKTAKAAGPDGVPPGIFKWLTDEWILLLTYLFNQVFQGQYPQEWSVAKLFTIYKKGYNLDPSNYRGISILAALAKIYDSILNSRFTKWFTPDEEQAGGQAGRGCAEHLLTLRLYIDIARKMKQTLYVLFVDYEKAYDRVNRNHLLSLLANAGCGNTFLRAIGECLRHAQNKLGNETFVSKHGVRQGGATSCSLFTFYINSTIRKIKTYGPDGFLRDTHTLLFMDDTVLLATSRDAMEQKLNLLLSATAPLSMKVHPKKSQYLTVNTDDKRPFTTQGIFIAHTQKYIYLGSPFMNASVSVQIGEHIAQKQRHIRKFSSFLAKNEDAPFKVKWTTWNSAMMSAILYGCESWMTKDMRSTEQPFVQSLKELLGVRTQTCSDLVYLELGIGSAKATVARRQLDFLSKQRKKDGSINSPLFRTITLAQNARCPMGIYLNSLDEVQGDPIQSEICMRKESVSGAHSTRRATYVNLNPTMGSTYEVYDRLVPEYNRKAFTRLRLSSHKLKIDTGRWSRIPKEARRCPCGEIQTEEHMLLNEHHTPEH